MTVVGLEGRVWDRLADVLDPCSCFTDEPVNIVDLGLVEGVTVDDGTAQIELLLTSPGCSYLPYIERAVEDRVGGVDGIEAVAIEQITDEIWTRERMDDDVREARRRQLRERLDTAGVVPYAERAD